MAEKSFEQWLYENGRKEALQDIYFEDQIGPGNEFLDWVKFVFQAMQKPASGREPYLGYSQNSEKIVR